MSFFDSPFYCYKFWYRFDVRAWFVDRWRGFGCPETGVNR